MESAALFRIIFTLVGIIVVILLGAWIARRIGLGAPASGTKHRLRVLQQTSLGARTRAVLVQIDGMNLLLGVTPSNVNVLHSYACDDPCPDPAPAAEPVSFKSILKANLGMSSK